MNGAGRSEIDTSDNVAAFVDAWILMTGCFADHALVRGQAVTTMFSNTVCPFLNVSLFDRPLLNEAAFADAIELARRRAAACPHASLVGICGEWAPADWMAQAADAGLAPSLPVVGMAADRLAPVRRPEPALEWRPVDDERTGAALGIVNAHAYGLPVEQFAPTGNLALWQGTGHAIVGYDDGVPVTSAATFVTAEMIYVAFVASLPGLQGRGYAEAAMRRAIGAAEAEMGPKPLWLHATDMGRPLYAAMGFRGGATIQMMSFT